MIFYPYHLILTELKTSSSPAIRNFFKRAGFFTIDAYTEGNPLKENGIKVLRK